MDPAGNRKDINRDGRLYSFFDEYGEGGIFPSPAQNDVNSGINRVAEYFKLGKIKIFSGCHNLIKELERYHWSEERETTLGISSPKPYKSLDHACDCLRYLVMSRFHGQEALVPMKENTETDFLQRIEEAKQFNSDAYGI